MLRENSHVLKGHFVTVHIKVRSKMIKTLVCYLAAMMKNLALILTVLIPVVFGQNFNGGDAGWYCGILKIENCTEHQLHSRCGTDGVTYINTCALGKAHCVNNQINQLHEGPCANMATTTRSPAEVVHGSEVILDFQCVLLSHRNCTDVHNEKICATDGITYPTFCEYEKARCTHRNLHVKHLGDCGI